MSTVFFGGKNLILPGANGINGLSFSSAVAKEEPIELMGNVNRLPGTTFRVALPNGHEVLVISGKMRRDSIASPSATR